MSTQEEWSERLNSSLQEYPSEQQDETTRNNTAITGATKHASFAESTTHPAMARPQPLNRRGRPKLNPHKTFVCVIEAPMSSASSWSCDAEME